jgi:anti-sigma factor RsiW
MAMSLLVGDLSCQQAVELVTDYLEGVLSRRERRRLERHLRACDGCGAYIEQVRAVQVATGRVGPEDLDDTTLEGLVQLFREHKGDEA